MACSSVLRGGGTNQELVLHCLHECGGDFLVSMRSHRDSPLSTATEFAGSQSRKHAIKFRKFLKLGSSGVSRNHRMSLLSHIFQI